MDLELKDKVVLATGGAKGIGTASGALLPPKPQFLSS
jgi:hypothetical protein